MSYLQQFVLVDKEESIKSVDFDWRNPYSASKLSRAVRAKNLSMVKKLIKGGCALDAPDNRGWTPLHEAATSDELADIAEVLIAAGAFIEHKTVDSETPLIIACKNKAERMVKILVDAGCVVNTRNLEYLSPLHIACCHKNENIIRFLISEGADVNSVDDEERTPIYHAIENVNVIALKILVEVGANLHTKDFFSRTPLQYTCMVGNLEIFDIIIDLLGHEKTVINQQTPEGWTLLMEAAQYKNYLIAEKLIEYGADTTLVDNRNLLALHIAAHCERYNVLELFLNHTPKETIERLSNYDRDQIHYRSLPCLIIDKNEFDSLVLLYEYGLSQNVLQCPVQMGSHVVSPISFLLLYTNSVDDNSKLTLLEYLLNHDYLLDPEYQLGESCRTDCIIEIKVISPIEAALMMHQKNHQDCYCDKFLSMILAKGVNPDQVPINLRGNACRLYLYKKAAQTGFLAGLDSLLKYSDRTEPADVLEMMVTKFLTLNSTAPLPDEEKVISHLVTKCTSEVNDLLMSINDKIKGENLIDIEGNLLTMRRLLKSSEVPSLKRLSRSAVRKHVHELTAASSKYAFRQFIRAVDLPSYITQYLLYEIDF